MPITNGDRRPEAGGGFRRSPIDLSSYGEIRDMSERDRVRAGGKPERKAVTAQGPQFLRRATPETPRDQRRCWTGRTPKSSHAGVQADCAPRYIWIHIGGT